MKASVGDGIGIRGQRVGDQRRHGEIVEVRGADGAPPYLVHWSDGHEALFFPGPDAIIEQLGASQAPVRKSRARPRKKGA